MSTKQKIAIIGGGISGMGTAFALHQSNIDFTLFEAKNRLGGHAYTSIVDTPEGSRQIELGVLGFYPPQYPNLMALFDYLEDAPKSTPISMLYWNDNREFWSSFQKDTALWKKLAPEVTTFYKDMRALKNAGMMESTFQTLGSFLESRKYSKDFSEKVLFPLMNMGLDQCSDVHQSSLYVCQEFMLSGGFSFNIPTDWYTWGSKSSQFMEKMSRGFEDKIRLNTPIQTIKRSDKEVIIIDQNGKEYIFDQVILTTDALTNLKLLEQATPLEVSLFKNFQQENFQLILHQDESILCPIDLAGERTVVEFYEDIHTFNLVQYFNLQHWNMPLLETLATEKSLAKIDPDKILEVVDFTWELYTPENLLRKARFFNIQGKNRTWYCGSPIIFGFHEDCLASGFVIAEQLGADYPFAEQLGPQKIFDFNKALMLKGDTSLSRT